MKKKLLLATMCIWTIIFLFFLLSWHPQIHFSSETISSIDTKDKILVLSFDDGPGEETNNILDVLAEKNVPAVFFLVGERIAWYENETARITAEGHEIGSHGNAHKFALFGGVKDYTLGKEKLEEAIGEKIIYYRPPYGFRTIKVVQKTQQSKTEIILWDSMPIDFLGWDAERISKRVMRQIKPGSIIVLHDGPEGREETTKAVNIIIDEARAEGYHFISLAAAQEIELETESS